MKHDSDYFKLFFLCMTQVIFEPCMKHDTGYFDYCFDV